MKAKRTLRDILDELTIEDLLFQASAQRDHKLRRNVVRELGRRGEPRSIPALIQFLKDEVPSVRAAAADALSDLVQFVQDEERDAAGAALLALLTDTGQPTGVRDTAAFVIGRLKYAAAGEALLQALFHPARTVRLCALAALVAIGDPMANFHIRAATKIERDPVVRRALLQAADLIPMPPAPRFKSKSSRNVVRNHFRTLKHEPIIDRIQAISKNLPKSRAQAINPTPKGITFLSRPAMTKMSRNGRRSNERSALRVDV